MRIYYLMLDLKSQSKRLTNTAISIFIILFVYIAILVMWIVESSSLKEHQEMTNVYYITFLKEYTFTKWGLKVGFALEFASPVFFITWGLVLTITTSCSACAVIVPVLTHCNIQKWNCYIAGQLIAYQCKYTCITYKL